MATWAKTDTPGKFRVRASVGSDHNGTRRRPTKIIHGTTRTIQAQADEWERGLRAQLDEGAPLELEDDDDPASSPTFAQVMRSYIDVTAVAEEWGDQHRDSREAALREIEAAPLGAVEMDRLRREDLAAYLAAYIAAPTRRGRPPAPDTVRARRVILGAVVGYAIDDPDLDVRGNPARKLGGGKTRESVVVGLDIPTVCEFADLVDAAAAAMEAAVVADLEGRGVRGRGYRGRPGYRYRAELVRDFALFALLSGMRRSEVCALRSTDVVHHDGGATILVRHSVNRRTGELKATKTNRSRTITVPPNAAAILERRHDHNVTRAMSDEVPAPRAAYIFSMGWGSDGLKPDSVTKWWEALRGHHAELEGLTLQHLRHSHASHLHHLGLHDKAIAEHMGHSVEVSRRMYNHVRPGTDVEMAAAIGAAWARA